MLDAIPTRAWLLALIAVAAFKPARDLFVYITDSPERVGLGPRDLGEDGPAGHRPTVSVTALIGLAAIAIFILTPAAEAFAKSPSFSSFLFAGFGVWMLGTTVHGYLIGQIEPMSGSAGWTFRRRTEPKRFWLSLAWNAMFGMLSLLISYQTMAELPIQALRDQCNGGYDRISEVESIKACDQLLAETSDNKAELHAARGTAYFNARRYRDAITDYAAAIRLDPREPSFFYNKGLAHRRLGEQWLAVRAYAAAIRLDPSNADAHVERGLIFLDQGRLDLAIPDFSRARSLEPDNAWSVANRGIAYAYRHDAASARRDFANVPMGDPAYAVVLRGEALLALQNGDEGEALQKLKAAMERDPENAWAPAVRAEIMRRRSRAGVQPN